MTKKSGWKPKATAGVPSAHPEYVIRYRLARLFKMTVDDYFQMLADQGGGCYLCEIKACSTGRRFAVDHDQSCCPGRESCGDCIRGLLCYHCNITLGRIEKSWGGRLDEYVARRPRKI